MTFKPSLKTEIEKVQMELDDCIEGDFVAGNVAIIEKVKDEAA